MLPYIRVKVNNEKKTDTTGCNGHNAIKIRLVG